MTSYFNVFKEAALLEILLLSRDITAHDCIASHENVRMFDNGDLVDKGICISPLRR